MDSDDNPINFNTFTENPYISHEYQPTYEYKNDGTVDLVLKLTPVGPINDEVTISPHFRNQADKEFGFYESDWMMALRYVLGYNIGYSTNGNINENTYYSNVILDDQSITKPTGVCFFSCLRKHKELLIL